MRRSLLALAASLAASPTALGDLVFFDDFDSSNGGVGALNFHSFADGWTITSGSVDLIGNGYYDLVPGHGLYLDLDGSTGQGATLTRQFALGPGSYQLDYLLAGSQRGDTNLVDVSFGTSSTSHQIASGDGPTAYSLALTLTSAETVSVTFRQYGTDNMGALLDNVSVAMIPTPSALLPLAAMGILGRPRRR